MSRWSDTFENHPVHTTLKNLAESLSIIQSKDEITVATVDEVSRIDKVIKYIKSSLAGIDPELLPHSIWNSLNGPLNESLSQINSFISNGNNGHLQNANNILDQCLISFHQYIKSDDAHVAALKTSALSASKYLDKQRKQIKDIAEKDLSELNIIIAESKKHQQSIIGLHESLQSYYNQIYDDGGVRTKISQALDESVTESERIEALYKQIFVGSEDQLPLRQEIKQASDNINNSAEEINRLKTRYSDEVDHLYQFYLKVYGTEDEDGNAIGGLDHDINDRIARLQAFEAAQTLKYTELNNEIESLLPGANSAGLATAYRNMKVSFDIPIKISSALFYVALFFLFTTAFITSIESINTPNELIKFKEVGDWDTVIKGLIYKLPYYAPVIWLAYFTSKRRSEFQRLQQEYAHKEALAMSYQSYKKQIKDLNTSDHDMLKNLIEKAIDAIAFNASTTLDGKHGDSHPSKEFANKLTDELLKSIKLRSET